jgi:7-carboxy-7-deazaguanine synthase
VLPIQQDRLPEGHGRDPERLRITEIFLSLQGESTHQGLPCVFVRTTGCNLRCRWCDTEYAFGGGETVSVADVLARVGAFGTKRVEITGGEPLLQRAVPVLAARLLERGYTVLCETSGERDIDLLPPGVKRIMDLKAPGSAELESNRWDNLEKLRSGDELKVVLADRPDFDWALSVIQKHRLEGRVPLLLSPVHGELDPAVLARWILESGVDARLNLQLHKQLFGPDARGV